MTDGATPDPWVMESYRLAVEMADRMSARRAVANAFFLTVNTTLVAVVGLRDSTSTSTLLPVSVCVAGIVVAACWWLLLQNYRHLNEAKYTVINKSRTSACPSRSFPTSGQSSALTHRLAAEAGEYGRDSSNSAASKESSLWCSPCGT
jgi:hypothetical protein